MKQPHPVIAELKRDRISAGLPARVVAERLYLTKVTLYARECGHQEPVSLADLDRWAGLFGKRVALVPIDAEQTADDLEEAS